MKICIFRKHWGGDPGCTVKENMEENRHTEKVGSGGKKAA